MSRHYFNQMSDTWDEAASERDPAKLRQMAKRLNIAPSTTVLDVGTGTGIFIPFLLSEIGGNGRIVAVDFAEKMLRKAQDKRFRGNIDYLCADVAHLPLGNEMFEVAVCYASFPHFHNKPAALKELSRVIKRGGRLFICHTSSRSAINQRHRQVPTLMNDIIPDGKEMQTMLSAAGFADIKIEEDDESYLCYGRKPN